MPAKNNTEIIFIIGAARSGTKLLRDLIAEHPLIDKIPFDVNYIWRLGNEETPHDELKPNQLTSNNLCLIKESLLGLNSLQPFLVEKTVSNCLRVDFVRQIFPDAKFIHLVRNGGDVIESAYRQWLSPPDWRYIIKKATTFPIIDAFGYGLSYIRKTIHRLSPWAVSQPAIWGPYYKGLSEDRLEKDLLEVCAIQWLKSLEKASESLMDLPDGRVHWLRYEDFVRDPEHRLRRLANFIGVSPSLQNSESISSIVETGNIGKGRLNFTSRQQELICPYLQQADILLSDPVVVQKFGDP